MPPLGDALAVVALELVVGADRERAVGLVGAVAAVVVEVAREYILFNMIF